MARIPEAELERLKREVSLVRLIQSQGHELKLGPATDVDPGVEAVHGHT